MKHSDTDLPLPQLKESTNTTENSKQSSQKKSMKASEINMSSLEQKESINTSNNAEQLFNENW